MLVFLLSLLHLFTPHEHRLLSFTLASARAVLHLSTFTASIETTICRVEVEIQEAHVADKLWISRPHGTERMVLGAVRVRFLKP